MVLAVPTTLKLNPLAGTLITVGWDILTPSTKEADELPAVGITAAVADTLLGLSGAMDIATGVLPVFKNAQKFVWSLPAGVMVSELLAVVVTATA